MVSRSIEFVSKIGGLEAYLSKMQFSPLSIIFLVLTQFLPKKIIDRGENYILLRYASNTPIFNTNCMDPHTIRKVYFRLQISLLHLGKILCLCGVINKSVCCKTFVHHSTSTFPHSSGCMFEGPSTHLNTCPDVFINCQMILKHY